ncbi:Sec-independent protein translocase protein TatB [Stappia sp.]|uniref:Sec-independent protein translocase protein TatB n=1 Tax=Stappia sp. TaxID=1870903 RepID=UPI0032D92290
MFDIGWTELIVVAVVMILVVGPKDLPRMLRTFGQTVGKVRRMAGEFQSTFNDALREAEKQADIADMKAQVEKAANFDPLGDIKKSIEDDASGKKKPSSGTSTKAAPAPKPAASETTPQDDSAKDEIEAPALSSAGETGAGGSGAGDDKAAASGTISRETGAREAGDTARKAAGDGTA